MDEIEVDQALRLAKTPFDYMGIVLNERGGLFEAELAPLTARTSTGPRITAFYLPQFHRIPENDRNWGAGFTEWSNVTRAQPLFFGHVQPRLPAQLGFYDLNVTDVMIEQALLASGAGVSAFCFYHYWFSGRKVLDMPLPKFASLNSKMEFSVCWANESWTRKWDGGNQEIIIGQEHGFDRDKEFIYDVLPYIGQSNYQKIHGRKLLLIYRAQLLGVDLPKTLNFWREVALKSGVGELAIYATSAFLPENPGEVDSLLSHLDGVIQFPPHGSFHRNLVEPSREILFTDNFTGRMVDYTQACHSLRSIYYGRKAVLPGVFPSWDNTPRRRLDSSIFVNCSPSRFEAELANAFSFNRYRPANDGIVFVNAWNEWAEGAILEPCRWFGYAYLNACARALNKYSPS